MTPTELATRAQEARQDWTDVAAEAVDSVRDGVDSLSRQLPAAIGSMEASARATTASLRVLPEGDLRVLMALSAGLGAGLYIAGAPRVVTMAAFAPALVLATVFLAGPTPKPGKHR